MHPAQEAPTIQQTKEEMPGTQDNSELAGRSDASNENGELMDVEMLSADAIQLVNLTQLWMKAAKTHPEYMASVEFQIDSMLRGITTTEIDGKISLVRCLPKLLESLHVEAKLDSNNVIAQKIAKAIAQNIEVYFSDGPNTDIRNFFDLKGTGLHAEIILMSMIINS
ncbi:hypothetical protein E0Z10_g10565 [Xylaria hypoxylon]|uniref:Uncharacterized protein n=1 Tax=Xylaria hypoxylon TaxID=37992 RepID=A0A4Z0Y5Q8_9PEZI|nr:hypothetical protein E0Z10_g10565 [Xylaria hypoxylon]